MTVMALARSDVVTVPPTAGADSIAELMADHSVGSVVVVDDDDRPLGLVTDRDLALAALLDDADVASMTAADVMTADPVTVPAEDGIYKALGQASDAGVRRLPVVDDDGTLAGIVTLDDFVVLLASEMENLSDIIQAESPPY
ncbi:MAG: CBS domain-containing protein [Halobacteriales archaeon]